MIVLLRHDTDAETARALLARIRELDLDAVPLDTERGKAFEVVGADPSRVQELQGEPGVQEILTRRTPLVGGEPVWPHFALRVAILAVLLLVVLALLSAFLPPSLMEPATAETPEVRPAVEWYLRPLDGFLQVFGEDGRTMGGILVLLFWLVLFLWPWIDRGNPNTEKGRKLSLALRGVGLLIFAIGVVLALGVMS